MTLGIFIYSLGVDNDKPSVRITLVYSPICKNRKSGLVDRLTKLPKETQPVKCQN